MPHQTILLAGDSTEDLEWSKIALKRAGISNPLQVVTGGEQALLYLNGEGLFEYRNAYPLPFLLLLQLQMSGRSGFDVLEWLLANPEFRPQFVVALAERNAMNDIRNAYELGVDSFLLKPLTAAELLQVLRPLPGIEFESGKQIQHRH